MFFHQKQEMNSSDFFRAHWSRHLCCKALVDRQAHVQLTSPSIYTEGTSSFITLCPTLVDPALVSFRPNHEAGHVFSPTRKVGSAFFRTHVYCDFSPCFADPALLSVVGFCGLKSCRLSITQRTRPLTSSPVSQSRVLPTSKLIT